MGNASTPTPPPGNTTFDCSYEGEIRANFTQTSSGVLGRFEGVIEVCVGGDLGSVCDIGWDEAAAQAVCRDRFGSNYGMLLSELYIVKFSLRIYHGVAMLKLNIFHANSVP